MKLSKNRLNKVRRNNKLSQSIINITDNVLKYSKYDGHSDGFYFFKILYFFAEKS
jgi:signal transduction histidine kinase